MTAPNDTVTGHSYLNNNHRPMLLAHRGSRILGPENTFHAFDIALDAEADALEIDIRMSRDKQLFVFHDEILERVTNGFGKLFNHTLIQLKHLDAAYHFESQHGEVFRGREIRLPTLEELFDAYPTARINIDIKDKNKEAVEQLVECISRANAERRVLVGSFHQNVIQYFREIAPEIPTAAAPLEVTKLYVQNMAKTEKSLLQSAALQIPPKLSWLSLSSPSFIAHAKKSGQHIHYWTINNSDDIRQLLLAGADGIVTDRVDLALPVFQELGHK